MCSKRTLALLLLLLQACVDALLSLFCASVSRAQQHQHCGVDDSYSTAAGPGLREQSEWGPGQIGNVPPDTAAPRIWICCDVSCDLQQSPSAS